MGWGGGVGGALQFPGLATPFTEGRHGLACKEDGLVPVTFSFSACELVKEHHHQHHHRRCCWPLTEASCASFIAGALFESMELREGGREGR